MLKRSIIGPALMLIGVFLYFNQGQSFGAGAVFANFWASMFIIPLGLFFHWLYFGVTGGKGVGLLIPGAFCSPLGSSASSPRYSRRGIFCGQASFWR